MMPKNTIKIMNFLLKNVEGLGYNINQLSKLNGISVGSAFKILKTLEKDNIILRKKISNASHYKLNLNNPETIKLCEILLLTEKRNLKGYPKIYADEIIKFGDAKIVIIFGSILKGKEFNDIDVLFVTNQTKKVNDFCLEISKVRIKPVVPLIMGQEDLIKAMKQRKEAILDMMKNGVVLKGESIFVEVIKNVNA